LQWKRANPTKLLRLKGGDINAKMLAENKCFCVLVGFYDTSSSLAARKAEKKRKRACSELQAAS
jgi:hypothetical protein